MPKSVVAGGTQDNQRWAYEFFFQGGQVVDAAHDGQIGIQTKRYHADRSC